MNSNIVENTFIVDLFHLEPSSVQKITYSTQNFQAIFEITLEPDYDACPFCGCTHPKIKNYVKKRIKHAALANRNCMILYNARRYVCPICKHTYYEKKTFVFKSNKISILTVINCLEDLKEFNETFTSVAKRYNISPTSVCSIFDKHVDIERKKLPKILNFDEVYAFRSKESKYVCVLLDFENQVPIDILPQRRKDYLEKYFENIPRQERQKRPNDLFRHVSRISGHM